MARSHDIDEDENERRSVGKYGIIKRRRFLSLAGAAAFAGATASAAPASAATVDLGAEGLSAGDDLTPYLEDHWQSGNVVNIPGGSYRLSDPDALAIGASQDAWLIGQGEVVADHSGESVDFNITARNGAHVRLENITLKGVDPGGGSRIGTWAPDSNAVIEYVNFNRPDGCEDNEDAGGFYVPGDHAGLLRYINCHVEGFSNNGIYASSPGKGENGPVEVYGGLYKNNDVACIRLGSEGSKVISATVVNDATSAGISGGNAQRGIRIREPGPVEVRDCDITHLDESGVSGPVMVENHIFESSRDGGLHVEGTRIRNDVGMAAINLGESGYDASGNDIHLSGSGNLDLEGSGPFDNVVNGNGADAPTTEKRIVDLDSLEPVDGGGGSGGGGTDGDTGNNDGDDSDDGGLSGRLVEVIAASGGPLFAYSFVATGAVAPITDAGSMSSEGNDTVTEGSDGSTEVTGRVGNGFGDSFDVEGDLTSFAADTDPENYTLRVDGEEVDPTTIGEDTTDSDGGDTDQSEVAVVAAEGGPLFTYSLLVAGSVEKVTDAGADSAEGNDELVESDDGTVEVTGAVGNGFGDTYQVDGSIDAFEADTDPENYALLVDGEEVDPADLGGSDGSDGTDDTPLPNRISFDTSDGRQGAYAFEVSGDVVPDPDVGDLEDSNTITDSVAEADISDAVHAYRYSGDVVALELAGAASVNIEDNE